MKVFSIIFVASVILAVQQTCNAEGQGKTLEVKIVATYDPPSSFSRRPPFYRAGSALTLSCEVEEVDEVGVIYEWTSTCSGNCFVRGSTTKTVSTRYLHSYDSGVHTCAVYTHRYTGNATIIVSVVGAGIYIESTDTVLSNNSLISTSGLHQNMPSFRCLSGSSQSRVGRLIDPLGNDITFSTSDPFFISRGGQHDPGTLYIRSLREFEPADSGIYIYRTPDENGNIAEVNVGLYHYTTSSAPILLDMLFSHIEFHYTFTCVSSLSPPTEVIWEVDGERIYFNDSYSNYHFTQVLVNRTTSTYNNTLSVNGTIEDVIGEYSCTVVNCLGSSNTLTKIIKVLEVSGHEDPLIVGVSRRINCTAYLNVTRMEWLLEGLVYPVEKRDDGGQELVMTLDPKNTDLDGAMFTCRIITARGITLKEAITINVRAIRVLIEITYSPPDQYPDYSPPNYRAASSVTLRCVATGTTGGLSYRWSSTCRSSCFAYSTTAQTISENMLRSRDAGVHTCTVTDGAGNIGTNSTTMNIVGAGIYIIYSLGTGTSVNSQTTQPNNSYAIVDTGYSNRGSYTRFDMYCCSNSSSSRGTFTSPNGYVYSSRSYSYNYITQYTGSSTYAGCTRFYYSRYYYYSLYINTGIYTCNIGDSRGNNIAVSIGLYSEGFNNQPSIYSLRVTSGNNHTVKFICTSRNAPPTNITWFRNGEILGNVTEMTISVTNRRSSYFDITLNICDIPDSIIGNYMCQVGNVSEEVEVKGLQMQCHSSKFMVGECVECNCSSDLDPISIEWYQGSTGIQQMSDNTSASITIPVTTDDEGSIYTCLVTSSCGTQKKTLTINTKVPDNWAYVIIESEPEDNALHGSEYTLLCRVRAITGMTLPPSMEWVGPDGTVLVSEENVTVGEVETQRTISTLYLFFHPVYSSQGGFYTCRATVNVPWMVDQPDQISARFNMPVTTQALFQLKLYPLPHCATWDLEKAHDVETSIKRELEKAVRERCECDFSSTAINSGVFDCQNATFQSNCFPATHVTYRAIINGTSDLLTADQLMDHVKEWQESRSSLLYNVFLLNLASNDECQLRIGSLYEKEC